MVLAIDGKNRLEAPPFSISGFRLSIFIFHRVSFGFLRRAKGVGNDVLIGIRHPGSLLACG